MTNPGLMQKLWPKWVLLFLFWTILGLAFAGQLYLSRSKIGDPVTWSFALERALADWYAFAVLSIPAMWLARRFPFAGRRWQRALAVHLVFSVIFSFGWMVLRAAIEEWQTRADVFPVTFSSAFSRALVATLVFNQLVYWGIIAGQHAFAYYTKFNERELHAAELEARLTEARLQALQMQLNPHFLFNTLNAIASLMHKDVEAADQMIVRLSDLLRYALESTDAQEVPLRQELDFLKRYIEIQQTRFGDRLVVNFEIPPETLDAQVPNLSLQPLVENAIQHGIEPHARTGRIILRARRLEDKLQLEVQDNGAGLSREGISREGVGLSNTRARLLQLHGRNQSLQLIDAKDGGLLVCIQIPWRSEASHKEPQA